MFNFQGRESRLVFHSKSCVSGDRAQTRRYCDQISSILQIFLPGCQDVQKILFARVPIIKYRHELTGFDCDLSMTSSSGLYMSCLLHIWGGADWRVRPLVSVIKHWAKSQKLVKNIRPTNYFTNFTLVMLVVCYLQQELFRQKKIDKTFISQRNAQFLAVKIFFIKLQCFK